MDFASSVLDFAFSFHNSKLHYFPMIREQAGTHIELLIDSFAFLFEYINYSTGKFLAIRNSIDNYVGEKTKSKIGFKGNLSINIFYLTLKLNHSVNTQVISSQRIQSVGRFTVLLIFHRLPYEAALGSLFFCCPIKELIGVPNYFSSTVINHI